MEKLRIVFMGTPEFAVGILDTIIKNKYEVVGVITAADKPAGRGQKIKLSAVKEYALANDLKLLQPTNLKDGTFLTELKWWDKDISWLRKNSSKFSNIKKIINHVTCIDR